MAMPPIQQSVIKERIYHRSYRGQRWLVLLPRYPPVPIFVEGKKTPPEPSAYAIYEFAGGREDGTFCYSLQGVEVRP